MGGGEEGGRGCSADSAIKVDSWVGFGEGFERVKEILFLDCRGVNVDGDVSNNACIELTCFDFFKGGSGALMQQKI